MHKCLSSLLQVIDITQQRVVLPSLAQPSLAQPSLAQHSPAQPSMAQHGPAWTSMDQHSPAQPSIAQHSLAQPRLTYPKISLPYRIKPNPVSIVDFSVICIMEFFNLIPKLKYWLNYIGVNKIMGCDQFTLKEKHKKHNLSNY